MIPELTMAITELPDFDNFSVVIEQLNIPFNPSQLHGTLCGYLCAGKDTECHDYLHDFLSNQTDSDAVMSVMALLQVSQEQINTTIFDFHLLLPHEDESLITRAQHLSEWCQGFITSLKTCDITPSNLKEEESKDAYFHLCEFSELDYQNLAIGEEDEKALTEVCEYVRMAVLMLHTEVTKDSSTTNKTLH